MAGDIDDRGASARDPSSLTMKPTHEKGHLMFLTESQLARAESQALEVWRSAADLVSARWETFLSSEREARSFAFASYVAALDAEEAAAMDLAACSTSLAFSTSLAA